MYLSQNYKKYKSIHIQQAPINDDARRNNQNLPGMGGVFNHINGNLYAYAANNPVHYIDPDGRENEEYVCDLNIRDCYETNNKIFFKEETIKNTDIVLQIGLGLNTIDDINKVDVSIILQNRWDGENDWITSKHSFVTDSTVTVFYNNESITENEKSNAYSTCSSITLKFPKSDLPISVDVDIKVIAINQNSKDEYYYEVKFK